MATRETTVEGQDLYTYKAIRDSLNFDGEHRGRLERFSAVVFGEIVDVFEVRLECFPTTPATADTTTCPGRASLWVCGPMPGKCHLRLQGPFRQTGRLFDDRHGPG